MHRMPVYYPHQFALAFGNQPFEECDKHLCRQLLGVEHDDTPEDAGWLAQKIAGMRIFSDEAGLMNKALADVNGNSLLISQL